MGRFLRGARLFAVVAAVASVLAACNDLRGPDNNQNSLRPEGPQAQDIDNLFIPVLAIAVVIGIAVMFMVVYAMVRFRRRSEDDSPKQLHGNPVLEFGSVVVSFILLAIVAVPTVNLIWELDAAPAAETNPLEVTVVGKQWWWEFTYTNLEDSSQDGKPVPLVTSTELHIPNDRPVIINLDGRNTVGNSYEATPNPVAGSGPDVIHSFWVPELNGKRDYVPGRLNTWKIEAPKAGKYLGQCAEYCGLSHANMRFRVISMEPDDFSDWVRNQRRGAAEPFLEADGATPAGPAQQLMAQTFQCTNCHSFDDSSAGNYGPNLTHVATRSTIGGGTHVMFETDELGQPTGDFQLDVLARWIHDATSDDYGVPQSSQGSRWPIPLPDNISPMPPNQGMPSFAQLSYVPTFKDSGKPDLDTYPLMSLAQACEIAEYLAEGRPDGMDIELGACEDPSTKPGVDK